VAARRLLPRAWTPVAEVFAFSAAAGIFASRIRSLDDTHDLVEHAESAETPPVVGVAP
jgi:hypothetical protein